MISTVAQKLMNDMHAPFLIFPSSSTAIQRLSPAGEFCDVRRLSLGTHISFGRIEALES